MTITVLFDHPLITPLRAIADWIPLLARREMIVERFRTVRIQGLPPTIQGPTATFTRYADRYADQHADRHADADRYADQHADADDNEHRLPARPRRPPRRRPDCAMLDINDNENLFMTSSANDKVRANLINSSANYTIGLDLGHGELARLCLAGQRLAR